MTRRAPPWAGAALLCLWIVATVIPAAAQHYNIATYQVTEGLPASQVLALFQDSRGYLWMGTTGGVARYNGHEFDVLTRADGLSGNTIGTIAEAPSGEILLGSREGGLDAWNGEGVRPAFPELVGEARVLVVYRDGDLLWVGTERGLLRIGAETGRYSTGEGLPDPRVNVVYRDARERLWVGTEAGLARWEQGRFRAVGGGLPPRSAVRALVAEPGGDLWVGTDDGLYREAGSRFRPVETLFGRRGGEPAVTAAAVGASGQLWFGTGRGALRVAGTSVSALGIGNGLADSHVNAVLIDREGNAWFGTDRGVAKLVPGPFSHFTTADGLPHDYVTSVAAGGDEVWVGTREGVARVEPDGDLRLLIPGSDLPAPAVTALLPVEREGLLVGTSAGLVAWRGEIRRRWEVADGLPAARITALARTPDGTVWVGTDGGLAHLGVAGALRIEEEPLTTSPITALAVATNGRLWVAARDRGVFVSDGRGFRSQAMGQREPVGVTVWSLAPAGDGSIWAGTNGLGALRFDPDGASLQLSHDRNGLANDFVQQVLVDADGRVWLYTNRGLDRWDQRVGFTHFDLGDGLGSMSGAPGAGAVGPADNLWFGTPDGLTRYRPGIDEVAAVPPTVVVEEFRAGGRPVALDGEAPALSPERDDVAFEFTALSFREEEATRYQYRLQGRDEAWSRPTRERRVAYVGLPPGDYTFQVQAISGDGLWSERPAEVTFSVEPALWESLWFRVLIGVLGLAAVALLFRGRLRQVDTERRRLREMVDRRTRELVEKNAQLERMATTDELTGLPNRRFFLESLEREFRKLTRLDTDQELSLLILDLDRFKSINDRYGHAAGDEVLRQVAKRLARGVRATDLPARFGGEEFAILLPNTGPDGARFLAEKLRSDIEEARISFDGEEVPLTISIGVATATRPERYSPHLEEDLLRRADEAMYRAKTGGRNRVEVDRITA